MSQDKHIMLEAEWAENPQRVAPDWQNAKEKSASRSDSLLAHLLCVVSLNVRLK